ncbi:bifunctional adenosine 5'-phosphosulfate phosphorylase/adenylylsulfatase HINT4 isoform X3 [Dendrobium catenatum]|uniref:bifunctional adenosine 5'-phosphosulfate phosphorylase/adenylylsulfatase HINT4 isoform X3 n=1 Tax=Dendrobium catenatum TaxID=906689 RepID=UPI00109FCF86|nr:bifunctional adenosine 5'-phosphosulfate phosphorylase/adenylylsulfatase HINT4 isoform X3 [Dendrobium catenatum]
MAGSAQLCLFCQIARSSTSTHLLYTDDQVSAFPDINPSAFRHYLVIPKNHIPTVNHLLRRAEDYQLVICWMLDEVFFDKMPPNLSYIDLDFINLHSTVSIISIFIVLHYLLSQVLADGNI